MTGGGVTGGGVGVVTIGGSITVGAGWCRTSNRPPAPRWLEWRRASLFSSQVVLRGSSGDGPDRTGYAEQVKSTGLAGGDGGNDGFAALEALVGVFIQQFVQQRLEAA
jgi:hypothetical protein